MRATSICPFGRRRPPPMRPIALAGRPRKADSRRNTLIGPGLAGVDVSLTRSFRIREGWGLQFRAEVFNMPNHPNFAEPSGRTTFTNAAGAVAPNWGRITATTSTSRQIQFGLKLSF